MDLERFVKAQATDYATALAEIKNGCKRSHWMWYIFPQLKGLGYSHMAAHYGIDGMREANAYLTHPVLGRRIIEISNALLLLTNNNATAIMGSPDDMKLRSSMTLFSQVPGADTVFNNVLNKFYSGKPDQATLDLLK